MTIIIPIALVIIILTWGLRPRKPVTNARKTVILMSIIPISVVAIAGIVAQWVYNASGNAGVYGAADICFIISVALIAAFLLTSIGLAIARKGDIARGLGFSACIAVLVSIVELALLEGIAGV